MIPVGRHKITAIRIRLYTVSCTPPVELPSQLCSSADVASRSTVPITGPHSVPTPPTIDTSAASIETLKLNAGFGYGRALGAAREVEKLQEDQHQDLRRGDRRNREIWPAQPEAQPADGQTRERGNDPTANHADPGRDAEIDLQDR